MAEDVYKKLGINIRKYRLNKNLSEMLNANDKFIGHIKRVERHISLKKMIL